MISLVFFFSSRRRHTRYWRDWSSDVCSSDLREERLVLALSEEEGVLVVLPDLARVGVAERFEVQQGLPLVPEGRRADPHRVPTLQRRGTDGLAPVDEGAVGRARVLDVEEAPVAGEPGVAPRGVVVALEDDVASRGATDAGLPVADREPGLWGQDLRVLDHELGIRGGGAARRVRVVRAPRLEGLVVGDPPQ